MEDPLLSSEPAAPGADRAAHDSGLKPITRLTSDTRIAKVVPETHASATVAYCSSFVRGFLRSDYNFCSSKFSVARDGKKKALDAEFRAVEEWFAKAMAWIEARPQSAAPIAFDEQTLAITHQFSGRLVRLLNMHDKLFRSTLFAEMAGSVSPAERVGTMEVAARRISQIWKLTIPDNQQFSADGALIEA